MPITLPSSINNLLLSYQRNHTERLIEILQKNNSVFDGSDTGTGKTYAAIATAKYLNLSPIIICPKSIISTWSRIAKEFGVKPILVTNYEALRMGNKRNTLITVRQKPDYQVTWNVQELNTMFIFDEAHRCRHLGTMNSYLLLSAKETNKPIMALSATIADTPQNFKIFTYILNFIDPEQVKKEKINRDQYFRIMDRWLDRDPKPMVKIHGFLYPDRASRIRIDDLGNLFPETQITANPYSLDKQRADSIEKEYKTIALELEIIADKKIKDKKNPLVVLLRSHQRIELLKVPIFVELANDLLTNGYSVVIFVNFTQTLKTLCKLLHTNIVIYGEQTGQEREKNINLFQTNKTKIIICNIMAGGVGISLHDLQGGHPRASLISPTWSSTHLTQALGRIHRAGGKTKSLQRIIYAANTVEESISEKVRNKLRDLNSINNGDLDLTNIQFIKKENRFMKI